MTVGQASSLSRTIPAPVSVNTAPEPCSVVTGWKPVLRLPGNPPAALDVAAERGVQRVDEVAALGG